MRYFQNAPCTTYNMASCRTGHLMENCSSCAQAKQMYMALWQQSSIRTQDITSWHKVVKLRHDKVLYFTAPGLLTTLPATWWSCLCLLQPGCSNLETLARSLLLQPQATSAVEPSSPPGSEPAQHPSVSGHLQQTQFLPVITLHHYHWLQITLVVITFIRNTSRTLYVGLYGTIKCTVNIHF
jgi:hypothetical protein